MRWPPAQDQGGAPTWGGRARLTSKAKRAGGPFRHNCSGTRATRWYMCAYKPRRPGVGAAVRSFALQLQDAFKTHLDSPYGAPFNAALTPLIEEDASVLTFLDPLTTHLREPVGTPSACEACAQVWAPARRARARETMCLPVEADGLAEVADWKQRVRNSLGGAPGNAGKGAYILLSDRA